MLTFLGKKITIFLKKIKSAKKMCNSNAGECFKSGSTSRFFTILKIERLLNKISFMVDSRHAQTAQK